MRELLLSAIKQLQLNRALHDKMFATGLISMTTYRDLINETNKAEEQRFRLLLEIDKTNNLT